MNKSFLNTRFGKVIAGESKIRIVRLDDPWDKSYPGREGVVTWIDSAGQLHGTWGGLAVIPEEDEFVIVND